MTFGSTNIQISVSASDPDGRITRVDFFANGSRIGSRVAPPYSMIWSNVTPSQYSLQALAVDNIGAGTYSESVQIVVALPPPPNDNSSPTPSR